MRCKKDHCPVLFGKRTFLFFSLLFPFLLQAQKDHTLLADSLSTEIQEVTPDEPAPEDVYLEDTQTGYFSKKENDAEGDSLVQRFVPDSLINKMQQDDDFWYANAAIKKEKNDEEKKSDYTPLGRRPWFQSLLWLIIIVGFAAALVFYLAGSKVGLFRKKYRALQTAGDEDEPETADIFAINYQKEIDKAEASGNYRMAIRLMFLRLLKEMAVKNIIQYKPDRTNLDYLLQLYPTGYYNHFFRITRNYEYSWYGQFEFGEQAYRTIRNDFIQFDGQLK